MKLLNKLTNVKTIFYNHSSIWLWINYNKMNFIPILYEIYKNSKFIISLIPFENDFLFKKWGINSILMNNFVTYRYDNIKPSDLTSKNIIMIGRANDKMKRFDLGLKAMKYIVEEIPESQMFIMSNFSGIRYLLNLVNSLNLKNNVKFVGYTLNPEAYFQNASLHIFPSISECFPMVLSETKIYGIPNIITGIDYVSAAKGGVINVNNDDPKKIANESIKILKDFKYRKKLGKIARESMKKFKNEITAKKWIELILAVYNGEYYYNKLKEEDIKIKEKDAINYLKNQLNIMKVRNQTMRNLTLEDIINFNFEKNKQV
jgi:glycosyltransferase involved in cell wall biosynthesis